MRDFIGNVNLTCPHCGFINKMPVDQDELNKLNITHCDSEEGGCDQPFVWKPTIEISATVHTINLKPQK